MASFALRRLRNDVTVPRDTENKLLCGGEITLPSVELLPALPGGSPLPGVSSPPRKRPEHPRQVDPKSPIGAFTSRGSE